MMSELRPLTIVEELGAAVVAANVTVGCTVLSACSSRRPCEIGFRIYGFRFLGFRACSSFRRNAHNSNENNPLPLGPSAIRV